MLTQSSCAGAGTELGNFKSALILSHPMCDIGYFHQSKKAKFQRFCFIGSIERAMRCVEVIHQHVFSHSQPPSLACINNMADVILEL